jgi:hypothetical protein
MLKKPPLTYRVADRGLLHNVLNEVLNGFALEHFEMVIGMKESEVRQLLAYLGELSDNTELELDVTQLVAFRNALRETLRELGREEFCSRTGYDFETGEEVMKVLNKFDATN